MNLIATTLPIDHYLIVSMSVTCAISSLIKRFDICRHEWAVNAYNSKTVDRCQPWKEGGSAARYCWRSLHDHRVCCSNNSAAAAAATESGNWEQRSEASDAQHLVGNSGRRDMLGGRHQRKHVRPLSLARLNRLQRYHRRRLRLRVLPFDVVL